MRSRVRLTPMLATTFILACSGGGDSGGNKTAPTAPVLDGVQATSQSSITLFFSAATDDYGVVGYRIYRDGSLHHDTPFVGTYVDNGLTPSTQYCYYVVALDGAGNASPQSETKCATTLSELIITKAGSGSGTVTSSPSGITCGAACRQGFTTGSTITLTASPSAGSSFGGWGGCDSTSGSTCTVTMTGTKTVSVTFNSTSPSTSYTLTVGKSGTGSGTVTSSPAGVSCGSTCSAPFASGTTVTLTATAAPGSTVSGWGGACLSASGATCTVTMTANTSVSASFTQQVGTLPAAPSNLTATSITQTSTVLGWTDNATNETGYEIGTCSGTATVGSDGSYTCTGTFTATQQLGANATSYSVTGLSAGMSYDRYVRAYNAAGASAAKGVRFTTLSGTTTYSLNVGKSGTGSGTVTSSPAGISCGTTCSASYASGTSVTLTATAAAGSTFGSWMGCSSTSGTTCNVTMTASRSVTATFSGSSSTTVTLPVLASNAVTYFSLDSSYANAVHQNTRPAVGIMSSWTFLGGSTAAWAGLVKFNTTAIQGKTIDSASLRLQVVSPGVGYYPVNFKIGAVATSWSPTSVTWNTMANFLYYTASWQSFAYPTYAGQIYNVDLKATAQAWANGSFANNGLGLLSVNYTSPGNVTSYDQYEFQVPSLTVTYR